MTFGAHLFRGWVRERQRRRGGVSKRHHHHPGEEGSGSWYYRGWVSLDPPDCVVGCEEEGDMRDKGSGCCRTQEDIPLEIRVFLGGPGLRSGSIPQPLPPTPALPILWLGISVWLPCRCCGQDGGLWVAGSEARWGSVVGTEKASGPEESSELYWQ